MALSKSDLKAKFVTGAIPTQTDFANLIDAMFSMPSGWESLTVNSVISEPGQYNIVAFGYNSTSLFTAFELTLTRNTDGHFIVGLLKQTEYVVTNGQFKPKIKWFSLAVKNLNNMPYYTGSKTFGDIVSFAKANLNAFVLEPNAGN